MRTTQTRREQMRRTWLATVLSLVLVLGCASRGNVQLVGAKIHPEIAKVGDRVKLTVEFSGDVGAVGSVRAVVREYPEYTFQLNDEGRMGDEKAGDGIWSFEYSVPYDAPAQRFHVDILVKDKSGKELTFGKKSGPAATVVVEVQ